jgi:hypothetical protein
MLFNANAKFELAQRLRTTGVPIDGLFHDAHQGRPELHGLFLRQQRLYDA